MFCELISNVYNPATKEHRNKTMMNNLKACFAIILFTSSASCLSVKVSQKYIQNELKI